jgi:hypothetical protein
MEGVIVWANGIEIIKALFLAFGQETAVLFAGKKSNPCVGWRPPDSEIERPVRT